MLARAKSRPLLVAAMGVASVTISCGGGSCLSGNFMARRRCPDGLVQDASSFTCVETCPPGQHLAYAGSDRCEFDQDAGADAGRDASAPTDAAADGATDAGDGATDAGDGG